MTEHPADVNTWEQQHLLLPTFVRIRCDILVDQAHELLTFSVSSRDESEDIMISAWSLPLRPFDTYLLDFQRFIDVVAQQSDRLVHPF